METKKRVRVRVQLPHWSRAFNFTILEDKAFADGYPDYPYDTDTIRRKASLWEPIKGADAEDPQVPRLEEAFDELSRQHNALCRENQWLHAGRGNTVLELIKLNRAIARRNGRIVRMKERIKQFWWHQAFCCWCDNRALDEPHEELEKRLKLPTRSTWLCNACATELIDVLEEMVRQHCLESFDEEEDSPVWESAALRVNCNAMGLLIKNKRMTEVGTRVGRMMVAKFNA